MPALCLAVIPLAQTRRLQAQHTHLWGLQATIRKAQVLLHSEFINCLRCPVSGGVDVALQHLKAADG